MNRKLAVAMIIVTNVLWGTTFVVVKISLEELPPPLLAALRFILATALLWGVLNWQRWRNSKKANPSRRLETRVSRPDLFRLAGLGLFCMIPNVLLVYWGSSLTTATDASLMVIGLVIFTSILAAFLLGERLGRWKGLGVVLGIIGAVLVVAGNAGSDSANGTGLTRAFGDVLVLTGLLCESLYMVKGGDLSRKYHPLVVLVWVYTASLVVWLPITAWFILSGNFPAVSLVGLGGVLWLALFTSLTCYLLWFKVIETMGANFGAISLFLQPLIGAVLGLALLNDPLTPGLLIGGLLILTALYFTTKYAAPVSVQTVAIATPITVPVTEDARNAP